ncbi:hypothetical protein Fot_06087 [Forsythia ovata]|uniref:Uncharacterized protein n=1 Tax=Forsythia ovata TaxID=205694 RepID=A0ABD1WV10_9LAMI
MAKRKSPGRTMLDTVSNASTSHGDTEITPPTPDAMVDSNGNTSPSNQKTVINSFCDTPYAVAKEALPGAQYIRQSQHVKTSECKLKMNLLFYHNVSLNICISTLEYKLMTNLTIT